MWPMCCISSCPMGSMLMIGCMIVQSHFHADHYGGLTRGFKQGKSLLQQCPMQDGTVALSGAASKGRKS